MAGNEPRLYQRRTPREIAKTRRLHTWKKMYKINELRDTVTGALPFGKRLWIHMLNGLKTSVRHSLPCGVGSHARCCADCD